MNASVFRQVPARQRGAAVLGIVAVIIFIVTMLTIFSARSTLLEIKTSANQYRYAQALNAAEYGVEQGIAYLTKNRSVIRNNTRADGWGPAKLNMWTACTAATVTVPCGDGTNNIYDANWVHTGTLANLLAFTDTSLNASVYFVTQKDGATNIPKAYPLITIVSVGTADGGNATTVVRRTLKGTSLLVNDLPGPLTVVGNTNLSGNYNIWGNKDGLGPNLPISVWSGGNVNLAGNAKTFDVRLPGSQYPNKASGPPPHATVLSDSTNEDIDIVDNSPDFPADLFYFLFGVPRTSSALIKANAEIHADCSSISSASYGLIWITGNCDLPDTGSADAPVIMIVEGNVVQNGNSVVYGIIYIMDTTPVVNMHGTVTVHGAILVDANVDLGNGTYWLHYDPDAISKANDQSGMLSYVEGSWNDDY